MKPLKALSVQPRTVKSISDEVERVQNQILERAYDLFMGRGGVHGYDLEDWLAAETELTWKPPVELREQGSEFVIKAALPGVDPKDLDIQVTPDELLIKVEVAYKHDEAVGTVYLCEFQQGKLFRRIKFPTRVEADKVKAEYREGLLRVTAPIDKKKLVKEEGTKKVPVTS